MTNKAIGPSFGTELRAAGLLGLPFAWGADGSFAWGALTDAQKTAVEAVYAAHDPSAPYTPVPEQVSMWAAQAALKQAGRYDEINATIMGWAGETDVAKSAVFFAWTRAPTVLRTSAFVTTLSSSQFGMTDAEVDAVFVAADRIARSAG